MSHNIKELRGQLRQLVKELLTDELVKAVEERLMKVILARLDKLDDKQKDLLGYVIRHSSKMK